LFQKRRNKFRTFILLGLTPFSGVGSYRRFGETRCLYFQGLKTWVQVDASVWLGWSYGSRIVAVTRKMVNQNHRN